MITIHHYRDKFGATTCLRGEDTVTLHDYMYMTGQYGPNYPVPAIRLAVKIDYEFICIWPIGSNQPAYYHDEYETVFSY